MPLTKWQPPALRREVADDESVIAARCSLRELHQPDRPYRYHCHLLDHEDLGMMGQFQVLETP